jgi:dihydrofolate synthase/folylpolyglutamate synthase
VHIAGTNGKGSVSHLLAAILQSAGYKTGLYTSPHIKDFRERIRINGRKIPQSYVTRFVSKNKEEFESINPSFFEYTAVMAFQYFADENVDIAIIETGMGGRLDSTNVITPLVSIITNISKDHTAFLGDSIPAIAREKAGIIKWKVPVLIGETQTDTRDIFEAKAGEMSSPLFFADEHFMLRKIKSKRYYIKAIPPESIHLDGLALTCPLEGNYQEKNILTVVLAADLLAKAGYLISLSSLQKGIRDVVRITDLKGRWQTIHRKPKVICDVGHNEAGIRYIVEQLKQEKFDKLHWVFGMVNDKDAGGILALLPKEAKYYFCKANIPRGLDAHELQIMAEQYGLNGEVFLSVKEAYLGALSKAGQKDLVFIGGSTFVVAELI